MLLLQCFATLHTSHVGLNYFKLINAISVHFCHNMVTHTGNPAGGTQHCGAWRTVLFDAPLLFIHVAHFKSGPIDEQLLIREVETRSHLYDTTSFHNRTCGGSEVAWELKVSLWLLAPLYVKLTEYHNVKGSHFKKYKCQVSPLLLRLHSDLKHSWYALGLFPWHNQLVTWYIRGSLLGHHYSCRCYNYCRSASHNFYIFMINH